MFVIMRVYVIYIYKGIIGAITKYSMLTIMGVLSTMFVATVLLFGMGLAQIFDLGANALLLCFMSPVHVDQYKKVCLSCHNWCYGKVKWFIERKEDTATK